MAEQHQSLVVNRWRHRALAASFDILSIFFLSVHIKSVVAFDAHFYMDASRFQLSFLIFFTVFQ